MPSDHLSTSSRGTLSRGAPPRRHDPKNDSPTLCHAVLDQIFRETVISRLRLAHTEPMIGGVSSAACPGGWHAKQAAAVSSLITRLSMRLRKGEQSEIDSLAEAIIQKHGLEDFFATIAPRVDATLRRQRQDTSGGLQDAPLGQWRLQELLQRLTPRLREKRPAIPHGRRVLLVGQEPIRHQLDLRITAECLSRDGWDVLHERQKLDELIEIAQREWFALLVIAAENGGTPRVAGIIRTLCRAACNPDVKVLVISEALARRPDRLARLGADAAAANISLACTQAQRLITLLPAQI